MKLVIDRKVSVGFLFALLALLSLIFLSFRNQRHYLDTTKDIIHQNDILISAEKIQKCLLDVEASQRGYVITGDSTFLRHYDIARQNVFENFDALSRALEKDEQNNPLMEKLQILINDRLGFAAEAIKARNTDFQTSRDLVGSNRGRELTDEIRNATDAIKTYASAVANTHRQERERFMENFNITFLVILGTAVVLLAILFILINESINVRARADEKVRMLNTELEAFSYSVSHDLRSPLRVIDGYALILHEDYGDKLDDDARTTIDTIIRNVRKMGRLIDDLLEFSRVSKKDIKATKIDLTPLVTRIAEDIRTETGCEHCIIRIERLEPARVDLRMIEQVWINLISNAVKYSSKKDAPLIEIGSQNHRTHTTYYVKDNGVGFNMMYKDKLFGIFQRLHRPEDFPGTGVGLAIVKRIVHRHGGNVWAESVVNEGSTFYFSLPNNH